MSPARMRSRAGGCIPARARWGESDRARAGRAPIRAGPQGRYAGSTGRSRLTRVPSKIAVISISTPGRADPIRCRPRARDPSRAIAGPAAYKTATEASLRRYLISRTGLLSSVDRAHEGYPAWPSHRPSMNRRSSTMPAGSGSCATSRAARPTGSSATR